MQFVNVVRNPIVGGGVPVLSGGGGIVVASVTGIAGILGVAGGIVVDIGADSR